MFLKKISNINQLTLDIYVLFSQLMTTAFLLPPHPGIAWNAHYYQSYNCSFHLKVWCNILIYSHDSSLGLETAGEPAYTASGSFASRLSEMSKVKWSSALENGVHYSKSTSIEQPKICRLWRLILTHMYQLLRTIFISYHLPNYSYERNSIS